MIYKKGKTLSILYISSLCAQDLTLFSAQLCAKLYYQPTMEKLSFCLPCQLSMSLVVKTVPESTEDFVILKTASRGTESSRPDHHGDDRYNIWINIQIKIWDFKVPSLKKKKNQNKVQLHLISCCHILKHCQWKCHLGRASNAHATPVCMLEHKTNLYRVFKEVTKNYSHWLYEKLHIWKKKKVPDVIYITLWQYFAKWTSLFTEV